MLRFNLLGPLEVLRDGEIRTPSAPMQRSLLGLLSLHANELLPARHIIDALWGNRPPRTAPAALQMYVTAVRRALAAPGVRHEQVRQETVLHTMPSGYLLRLAPEQLDLAQFRDLAREGRRLRTAGRCDRAGALFRHALALWRGPALADLDRGGVFDPYVVRLEEERIALVQERIAVDLCRGRGIEVVAELEQLRRHHPLRESLSQLLMLALFQAGRRAEALEVFALTRRQMVREVGIEPGRGLCTTQQAILHGAGVPDATHPVRPAERGVVRVCDPVIFGGWSRTERAGAAVGGRPRTRPAQRSRQSRRRP